MRAKEEPCGQACVLAPRLHARQGGLCVSVLVLVDLGVPTSLCRQGRSFEVELVRSSVAFVREMERLCWLLEEHAQLIKR